MGNDQSYQQNPNSNFGLSVHNSQALGRNYVTDSSGRAVYIYTKDPANKSVCTGSCATQWPPVVLPASLAQAFQQQYSNSMSLPQLAGFINAPGITSNKLGVTPRADGSLQLSFNNWPLYYYYLDSNPGDIKGQTVNGIWYLIGPDGNPIITPIIPQYQPNPTTPAQNGAWPSGSNNPVSYAYSGILNNPMGLLGSNTLNPVGQQADGVNITPYANSTMGQHVSYSSGWKNSIGYRNFRNYYYGKKWRNYAVKNDKNWQDYNEWGNWYRDNKNRWNSDYTRNVYRVWLQTPDDDWEDYNQWHEWDRRNVNPYY